MVLWQAANMLLLWHRTSWGTYLHCQHTQLDTMVQASPSHHASSSQTSPPPLLVNAGAQAQLTDLAPTTTTASTSDPPAFDWSDDAASIPIVPTFPKNQADRNLSALRSTNPNPFSSLAHWNWQHHSSGESSAHSTIPATSNSTIFPHLTTYSSSTLHSGPESPHTTVTTNLTECSYGPGLGVWSTSLRFESCSEGTWLDSSVMFMFSFLYIYHLISFIVLSLYFTLVVGKSGSELQFEPEPLRTGPEVQFKVQKICWTELQVQFRVQQKLFWFKPVWTPGFSKLKFLWNPTKFWNSKPWLTKIDLINNNI